MTYVSNEKKKDILAIIDGHALVHRAYHAFPQTLQTSSGQVVNAAYGFTSMLLKLFGEIKPKYVVCTFDTSKPTFRHSEFVAYKEHRKKADAELVEQFPIVRRVVEAMNIPVFSVEGYEADDLIGTISAKLVDAPLEVLIVTGDQDTLQLVNENTKAWMPGKSFSDTKLMDKDAIFAKFTLEPKQIIDYKGLRGDPSDNIPGVKGIGEKSAIELISKYKTIEQVYEHINELKPRYQKLLRDNFETAMLSKKLATIDLEAPIQFRLEDCVLSEFDEDKLKALFQELEFRSLIRKIPASTKPKRQASLFDSSIVKQEAVDNVSRDSKIYKDSDYFLVNTQHELEDLAFKLEKSKAFAFDTETDGLDNMNCRLVGLSVSLRANEAYYVPIGIIKLNNKFTRAGVKIVDVFANSKVKKIAHNAKFDIHALLNEGFEFDGLYFDTMIAAYLISNGVGRIGLKDLAFNKLGIVMEEFKDIAGKENKAMKSSKIDVELLYPYAARDSDATLQLFKYCVAKLLCPDENQAKEKLKDFEKLDVSGVMKQLEKARGVSDPHQRSLSLLLDVEIPTLLVLVEMERNGICIDVDYLTKFGKRIEERIDASRKEVFEAVGHEFNINSPKQLGEILFEEMNLPKTRKLKSGGYSTDERYLERMKDLSPVIPSILAYRELYKLKTTYIDSLVLLAKRDNNKIHTSYNQAMAVTGRLSSSSPNLQNIPVRTELGQEIREGFVASKDSVLVGLDYSQQEMRLLAHLANEEKMIEAFKTGLDIHAYTASQVFNKDVKQVEKHERDQAKTVNFGIIYGISAFGLSQSLEIPVDMAGEFIERFFESYGSIRDYYSNLIETAKKTGYVETILGRRKNTGELLSSNARIRNRAFRETINFPIQGSAADIVKLSMIKTSEIIKKKYPECKVILQIHDELVFDVPLKGKDLEVFIKEMKETMENIYPLRVYNKVDASVGKNWREMRDIA